MTNCTPLPLPFPGFKRRKIQADFSGGHVTSDGGVRSIWLRHNLQIAGLRLKRLEKWAAENTGVLTESQVQALEQAKEEKEAHGEIETPHPGFLLGQDTCYIGYIT